jgi:hypothetical protein
MWHVAAVQQLRCGLNCIGPGRTQLLFFFQADVVREYQIVDGLGGRRRRRLQGEVRDGGRDSVQAGGCRYHALAVGESAHQCVLLMHHPQFGFGIADHMPKVCHMSRSREVRGACIRPLSGHEPISPCRTLFSQEPTSPSPLAHHPELLRRRSGTPRGRSASGR